MSDIIYMKAALEQARCGLLRGEPPFGAVIVSPDGEIVVRSHDRVIEHGDMSSHAETLGVREACRILGSCDLKGYQVVTTVEPCAMCFTTAWLNGITRIVFGATMLNIDDLTGGQQREMCLSVEEMNARSGELIQLESGLLRDECIAIFREYTYPVTKSSSRP